MKLPLELVSTLLAVIDEGSFEGAARRLHITPSAVSQRVRTLEDRLGGVLVVRSRPVRPTTAGGVILRLARQMALLEHDALAELGRDDAATARISLAVNADSLATWLLEPLARLSRQHPVVFDLHRDDQDFTAALLADGTALAGVTSQADPIAGCVATPLGTMAYEAVATPAFVTRWLGRGATVDELEAAPLVDFDRRDDLQTRWLVAVGADSGTPPRHFVPASHDFAAAVRAGLGWGMLPLLQCADALTRGELVRIGGPGIPVALYWQQWNLHSPLLGAVAAEVITAAGTALSRR
jgi:LysR family transcriptional regulator (chromosome initiation inhibitor)